MFIEWNAQHTASLSLDMQFKRAILWDTLPDPTSTAEVKDPINQGIGGYLGQDHGIWMIPEAPLQMWETWG